MRLKNLIYQNSILQKVAILFFIVFLFIIPIILHIYNKDSIVLFLLKEGSIYETIGALSALASSIIFFYLYKIRKKYITFFLLGILLFFLFGEEISWGQRIFNYNTPEYFANINYQNETNVHNLNLFHNQDRALFDYGQYLIIIYFVYLTLVVNIFSDFKVIFTKLRIPVGSLFIAFLLIFSRELNNIIEKIFFIRHNSFDVLRVGEIHETVIELLFLIFAYECFKKYSKIKKSEKNNSFSYFHEKKL